ncbi:MAG: isoleucine--tRNA ligase [Parcubacteria group bacterium]
MFKKIDPKTTFPKMEEEILKFWEENNIFEKSLEKNKDKKHYVFYDGPPFATGTPHYGHIVGSVMKDVVPRYWTMRGRYVERKWGWDCHGLPIENIAEKELGIKRKKEIEEMGVEKFNEFCRSKVLSYVSEWEKVIGRLGRWADMGNAYKTMDLPYMESVWYVFKELWDKGLIYESYRSMHICTRCETTLSQQEVSEGYKDIKDLSCIAKFELVDEPGTFVLAWTTTPWTLIGNVALAVGAEIDYVKVKDMWIPVDRDNIKPLEELKTPEAIKFTEEYYIIEKNSFERYKSKFHNGEPVVIEELKGADLVGKKYKPLFDYYQNKGLQNEENGWQIYAGDFVTTEEGTGVVHIAPAFGEDDFKLSQQYDLPFIQHVGMDGTIKKEAGEFAGLSVKPITGEKDSHQKTDIEIIKYLAHNGLLFSKEKYEHSYPHCWRCDTPLINYATSSWFVAVTKVKERALELAKGINWTPKNIKEGRFGNWLSGARDWSISRQRFWASVMPIWKCKECGEMEVFGSVADLEKRSGAKVTDLHKHVVDKIKLACKCGGEMSRVPDVLDTWFDSGSMPYAQMHYPLENKEKFEANFPAEFIAEGVDQTRAWFYYMHILSSAIKDSRAYNNVIVNGIVLAEDGKKMAKKLKNYPDPMEMFHKYGADAMRVYLMGSPVVAAENLSFKESDVAELTRGMFRMLWNSYSFFVLYADIDKWEPVEKTPNSKFQTSNLLDRWIISELNVLIGEYNKHMEAYELNYAVRLFPKFIDNLSNWHIRRSRKRFWKSEDDADKEEAYRTLHYVLVELAKLLAPFAPFMAEEIFRNLTGKESVHLEDMPVADESMIDSQANEEMALARAFVNTGLKLRAEAGIKVRQPLYKLYINQEINAELKDIIKEEVNVREVVVDLAIESAKLDTLIDEELELEGQARETIRFIQEMRKAAGYEVDNRIKICYAGKSAVFEKFGPLIAKETLATELLAGDLEDFDLEKEIKIGEEQMHIKICRG